MKILIKNLTDIELILFNNCSSSPIIKSFVSDNIWKLNANGQVFTNFNTCRLENLIPENNHFFFS